MSRTTGARAPLAAALTVAVVAGCDAGSTKVIGTDNPTTSCLTPTAPPAGTNAFYGKVLDANGIAVMSSAAVADEALTAACAIVVRMGSLRDAARAWMIAEPIRVAVIGIDEVTTNIPEYANLYSMFQGQDWDRLRGVGATTLIPVASVGEENLLCATSDVFAGEKLLVQTFATAVLLGVESTDSTFESRLDAAYDDARRAGLWQGTYHAENPIEYYAEGVQDWFDANSPPDSIHNDVNTRSELRAYDPALAKLIGETMPDDSWRPACP